ncbi:MAG: trypsin-like peptidase domain-containing protein [Thermodesulfobacteriota bacterium]|nr:trypsin-like peptidase domain-containing protein [Thermodesulfobacteriota bacterium]
MTAYTTRPANFRLTIILLFGLVFLTAFPGRAETFSRKTPVVLAVERAGPAVVNISTSQAASGRAGPFRPFGSDDLFSSFFRDFFEPSRRPERPRTSLGSGVIIDGEKGFILTNEHVVGQGRIMVSLGDEREYKAELVGSDPDSDLAVLQIKTEKKLPALAMGDSSSLMIGETVIAIGNPFGLTHTVTTGVISAVNRSLRAGDRVYRDFIQTDASINPGNSGGPLLNINGQLIGINTAIYDKAEGIGFAIPINRAKRIIQDLISYGEVHPAWLGLSVQTLDARLARYFRVSAPGGALITSLDSDGPAAGSGLKQGDVIVNLGQRQVKSVNDYEDILKSHTAREKIELTALRRGNSLTFIIQARTFPLKKAGKLGWDRYGLVVAEAGKKGRVVIDRVRLESPAGRIGLKAGDIIHQINEIKIVSKESYLKAMAKYRFRLGISAIVQRGRTAYRITLRP